MMWRERNIPRANSFPSMSDSALCPTHIYERGLVTTRYQFKTTTSRQENIKLISDMIIKVSLEGDFILVLKGMTD